MSDDKIRVMLVDDIAETRDNIRKLLQFESDIEVIADARTGKEAIDFAKKHQPHVVLMDINMPDMDGIKATEAIISLVPRTQIIILSVQNEPDYMRRAMIAGARDFLTKPPIPDELIATIRRMHEQWKARAAQLSGPTGLMPTAGQTASSAVRKAKIITVYSPKGGSGTTTVATNLALALQGGMRNSQVLLIDGDLLFGDVGIFLNIESKFTMFDVAQDAEGLDNEFLGNVFIKHENNLRILLAPTDPATAEMITGDSLKAVIEVFRRLFDYIVIDTGVSFSDALFTFMDLSDRIVLLTTPDIPSIAAARKFFEVLAKIGFPEQQIFFVVNRVDKNGISPKDISESLKHAVRGQIPFDHYGVLLSINRGQPVVLNPKANPVAEGIKRLAATLVEDLKETQEVPAEPETSMPTRPAPKPQQPPPKRRLFGA